MDEVARVALRGSSLPHSLVGAAVLFTLLACTGSQGEKIHDSLLAPGSALALAWMPSFFVPALVALPLCSPVVATARDALAASFVIVFGLFATLATTASASAAMLKDVAKEASATAAKATAATGPSSKFGEPLFAPLLLGSLLSGALAIQDPTPLKAGVYFALTTLATYVASSRASKSLSNFASKRLSKRHTLAGVVVKAAHPVAVCGLLTTLGVRVLGSLAQTLDPLLATTLYVKTGGAALQRLLGGACFGLACGVYAKRHEIRESWRPVSAGVATGVSTGVYGTAILVRLLRLPDSAKLALLPRCITSPLAIAFCNAMKIDPSASVVVVVATGILGAAFGPSFLARFDPKSRGLAMGAGAHGVGTAQLANEPNAQAYASISMSLVGALSVALATIPATRSAFYWLAGVSATA